MKECILITGIGGQDGSYLAGMLCHKADVHGMVRRSSCDNKFRLNGILDFITLHHGDMQDPLSVARLIYEVRPNRIFNMADQDDVMYSYATPNYSMDVTATSVMNLLEIVRCVIPSCIVFHPVSSTIFGDTPPVQDERSHINPLSPYAIGKATALHICEYYRRMYKLHVITGIMFNHHSPRRKSGYLIDMICLKALDVAIGRTDHLEIYDSKMLVDIGHAEDFMRMAIDLKEPGNYVFATGRAYEIRHLAEHALKCLGCRPDLEEIEGNRRPGPRHELVGNSAKLMRTLNISDSGMRDAVDMINLHLEKMRCG